MRELARRIHVHPNTVSAAYQDLAARGWAKRKAGSGVFVADVAQRGRTPGSIDTFLAAWIDEAAAQGFSLGDLRAALDRAQARAVVAANRGPLVVHPDRNLAHVLASELEEAPGFSGPFRHVEEADALADSLVWTTTSGVDAVAKLCSNVHGLIPLKGMEEMRRDFDRPNRSALIGTVSRSETILRWVSRLIAGLGLPGSDLIARNPEDANWRDGLAACDIVVADISAARELPKTVRHQVLRITPQSFLAEARPLVTARKA